MQLRRLFSPVNLRLLLALIVLAAFLPAFGLVLYTGLAYRNYVVESVRDDSLQSTRLSAGDLDVLVEGSRVLLVTLAHSEEVQSGDAARISSYFAALLVHLPQYANLAAVHTDGMVFASGLPLTQPVYAGDQDYFQRTLEKRDFAGGDYQVGRISEISVLVFGYPAFNSAGAIEAVVYASLDLSYIKSLVASRPLPENGAISVIDQNGTILVRYPDPEALVGRTLPEDHLVRAMLERSEGLVELAGLDGVSRIYSFTTIRGTDDNLRLSIGIPRGSAYATANRLLLRNLLLLGLVALLALGGAAAFSEFFVLRRMRRLVCTTDRLAAGDLSARTGISGASGELGRLASSFDAMAETLERRNAELEDHARKLQDFLDIAGHELRHPITIISGYVQALPELGAETPPERLQQISEAIRVSAGRLTAILDDLLDVSRIESGRFPVQMQKVSLQPLLAGALEEMKRKSPAYEFMLHIAPDMGTVNADPTRLYQLLVMLLDNAVSYTPASSPVELTAERRAGQILICCMDRGPGIPEEAAERIFERFGQVFDVDHHPGGGMGVGLYIARRIAEEHGGRLWYESREGGGSRFCLSLPAPTGGA